MSSKHKHAAQHTACNWYKWIDYRYDIVEYKSVANQHIKAPVKSKIPKVYKDVGQTRKQSISKAQDNCTSQEWNLTRL